MPAITLSLPAALGLLTLFLTIGAVLVYFALRQTGQVVDPTITPTITLTTTPTVTATPETPTPTFTPLPSPTPLVYTVKAGDSCLGIAFSFGVSVNSIVLLNDLPAACNTLIEGQKLLIPQPTPTPTPLPTATLSAAEATVQACSTVDYTVQENDTLSGIAANYNVPIDAIRQFNGLVNDTVRFGQPLVIPLCQRAATPGPTPTPTLPPPYGAPNLLLPADGAVFRSPDDTIALQWSSVGTLRDNESYQVSIEDVTSGQNLPAVDNLTDTKYIVPQSFSPTDNKAHAFRWSVRTVRQVGTDDDGKPIWETAGETSVQRIFIWTTSGAPVPTAAP